MVDSLMHSLCIRCNCMFVVLQEFSAAAIILAQHATELANQKGSLSLGSGVTRAFGWVVLVNGLAAFRCMHPCSTACISWDSRLPAFVQMWGPASCSLCITAH